MPAKVLLKLGKYRVPSHIYVMGRKIKIKIVKQHVNSKTPDTLELGNADFTNNSITLRLLYTNKKPMYSDEEMVSVFLHELLHWKVHLLDGVMDVDKEEQLVIRDSEVLMQIINQII